jgi:DNA-directed RNA polymerase, mitochondrial
MSSIIRDTFVSLHSSHVMSRLQDEFRTRYKDFKVPLTSIRSPNLYRKLKAAGTTRKGRSKRIREVEGSATSTSLNVGGVMDEMLENEKVEVDTILEAMDDGVDAERSFAPDSEFESDSELELESESEDSDSEGSIPNARHPLGLDKARKLYTSIAPDPCLREQLAENVEEGKGKSNLGSSFSYFYLTDLLPPLPKKGNFDVGSVRGSGYFFS